MKGFQISFITEQNQRIEGKPASEWLIHLGSMVLPMPLSP